MEKNIEKHQEIILKLKNFKKLEDFEVSLKDSYLYLAKGKNATGKSTLKQAFSILLGAKNDIDTPVTIGKDKGTGELVNMPGADGRKYIVQWNFTNDKDKFIVIDDEGKKISKVEDIRNIFKFKNITVEDFMAMSLNAKGREELKKLFLSFLTEEEQKKYAYIKAKEKETYDARTKTKIELEYLVDICKDSEITKDEASLLLVYDKSLVTFNELGEEIKSFDNIKALKEIKDKRRKEVSEIIVTTQVEIDDYNKQIEALKIKIQEKKTYKSTLEEEFKTFKIDIIDDSKEAAIRARYEKGKTVIENMRNAKMKEDKFKENDKKRNDKLLEWNTLDSNIREYRDSADTIIKNSKMPVKDIEFEDDGIKINGLSLKENQVSKAETMIIVTEILCLLCESPLILIGSANDLDNEHKKAIVAIAKKYDRMMIADEVNDDYSEIIVVGYDKTND